MPAPISDSRILLTGATGGLGHAIARALARRGARLMLTSRRVEILDQLQAELGDRAEVVAADLGETDDVARLCASGPFDVLVANAGIPAGGSWDNFSSEEIDHALDVNLRAPMQLARALAPAMVERGQGHIVLVSSLSGKVVPPGSSIYSATKFGLRGFGFGMNEDLRGTGVGVTTIFPGFISNAGMFHDSGQRLPKGVGMRTPEDVAKAVVAGIDKGRAEIDVAPVSLRLGGWLFGFAPSVTAAVQRALGGSKISSGISEGQRTKS